MHVQWGLSERTMCKLRLRCSALCYPIPVRPIRPTSTCLALVYRLTAVPLD